MKTCVNKACGQNNPQSLENYYVINGKCKNVCKYCHRLRVQKHNNNNKLNKKIYNKQYNIENKKEVSKSKKDYYENNKEDIKLKIKAYRVKNRSKVLQKLKEHYEQNKERLLSDQKEYRKKNRGKINAIEAKRHAAKLQRTPQWLTKEQWVLIENFYKKARVLTETTQIDYHVDHIIPLQGDNVSGLHVPWNLQILTATENSKKHNKLMGLPCPSTN